MDNQFSEILKCPICTDIFEKEIFQCINGHTICILCSTNLRKCPQCRVNFVGKNKIRNRALENLMDFLRYDCTNKELGCEEKISRGEISKHKNTCLFGLINYQLAREATVPQNSAEILIEGNHEQMLIDVDGISIVNEGFGCVKIYGNPAKVVHKGMSNLEVHGSVDELFSKGMNDARVHGSVNRLVHLEGTGKGDIYVRENVLGSILNQGTGDVIVDGDVMGNIKNQCRGDVIVLKNAFGNIENEGEGTVQIYGRHYGAKRGDNASKVKVFGKHCC